MDNKAILDEYKGKVVRSISLTSDYQLQIDFEDNTELEVLAVDNLGGRLQVNCDVRIQKTLK